MKSVSRNKIVVIPVVIVLAILLLVLFINTVTNNQLIKQILPTAYKQEEEEKVIEDGILCKVLDNTGEKIKGFVTIQRAKGIEKIEYIASDGETICINGNNRQKITIDTEMLVNEELQFKVTSNGEEKIETISLNSDYINDYIKIAKLNNEEEHDQVVIEFNPVQESTNYYKVNKGPWVQYLSTLSLDLSDIDIEKLQNGENDTTVYAKCVDNAGNTLTTSKTIGLTKKYKDFDLFHNMEVSGKTNPSEYGISGWWNYSNSSAETRNFDVRKLGCYLPQGGSFNYSATFTISNISGIRPIKAKQLYFTAYHVAPDYFSSTYSIATIYYTDGTSTSSSTNSLNGYAGQISAIYRTFTNTTNLQDKPIDRIIFNVSGHRNAGGIQTNITGIVLKGIEPNES